MNYPHLFAALMKSVLDVAVDLDIPQEHIRWPETSIELPPDSPALTVDVLAAGHDPVTLGRGGEDEHTGLLQLGIICPLQNGTAVVNSCYQTLLSFYVIGRFFSHEDTTVEITQCRRSPTVGNKTFVSVSWRSRFQRNPIFS